MNIHEALLKTRHDVGIIGKGDRNTFHNFAYRGIDAVLNRVGPALLANEINVIPELRQLDSRDITTDKGKRAREVTVTVAYTYQGPEGDSLVTVVAGEASDLGDSAVSKAMSVALRIAHTQMLQIPTGESDPAGKGATRGADPMTKLKNEIWAIAEEKGWITDGDFTALAEDYTLWSQGGVIAEADLDTLKEYRTHLKPPARMRRPGGETK
jgi:hypothetical protein